MLTWVLVAALFAPHPMAHAADSLAVQASSQPESKPKKTDGGTDTASAKKSKKSKTPKPAPAPAEDGDAVAAPDEPTTDGQIVPESVPRSGAQFTWKKHPSFRAGKAFRIDLKGQFQEDAHASYPRAPGLNCPGQALPTPCTWELHRNRLGVEGELFKHIEFEIEREFTEQELTEKDVLLGYTPESQWKDVNVNLTYVKDAQVQIGKMKVPFGLDELTGVTNNDFVYRSLGASYLAPARDVGVMVHGSFFRHGLQYATGVFEHDGDHARSKKIAGGDTTFAGRLIGTPFRATGVPALGVVEVATAYTLSKLSDDSFRPNGLRGRTVMTQDTFYESVYVKGLRKRWEADVDWAVGPFGARAEYTLVRDNRQAQGLGDEDLPDARAQAWYVSGTWIITGEQKTRPVKASKEFVTSGIGAIELAGRFERMWFDSVNGSEGAYRSPRAESILPSGNRALTLGVNWTLNRFTKLQFNVIREHVEDVERNPVPGSSAFWSRVLRLQFVL
jgi:phosphate-selective porin OprO and OprP